jgi:hypothetical protein
MKKYIQIGTKDDGSPVQFDIARLILTRLLICANSGGGKSWLLRLIAELLFDVMPVIIFDIEGEFVTLRDKFDFVLVGPGGETPADPRSAKLVIQKLLELRVSAVIDLSELSIPDRHLYVKLAAEAAINSSKHLWRPTCFMFDEAHEFCPENGKGESIAKGAVLAFATKGRKRQFLAVFATQRVHKLALDCRAELLNRLIGMTFEPDDLKTAAGILGKSGKEEMKDFSRTMRTMDEGRFFAFGRAICLETELIKVGMVTTRHGTKEIATAKPPPVPDNIKKLLPKLADLPELAEEKAANEKELREQLQTLKRELRDAKAAAPAVPAVPAAKVKIEKVNVLVLKPEHVKLVRDTRAKLDTVLKECAKITARIGDDFATVNRLTGVLDSAQKVIDDAKAAPALPTKQAVPITPKIIPPAQLQDVPPFFGRAGQGKWETHGPKTYSDGPRIHAPGPMSHDGPPDEDLTQGEIKVLTAVAQNQSGHGVTREHISILTGYKQTSRKEYLRQLRAKGLIEEHGDYIRATESGIAALGNNYKPLPVGVDLIEHYLRTLSGGELRIFEYALKMNGEFSNDEQLEAATSLKQTSRKEYIRQLRARHVLIEAGRGRYKLAAAFSSPV